MVRFKQALIVVVGLAVAAAMVVLGIWQLDVYKSQGNSTAAAKAAAPPLALTDAAPVGSAVREGFGRSVRFQGRYDPSLQLFVGPAENGQFRVLSALVQADGSIVPVVRGVVGSMSAPPPPEGPVDEVGVLLPSEDDAAAGVQSEQSLDAVRLPVLAQRWPGQLIGGFVTLSAADSEAQGMSPAPLALPEAKGRLRNGAYAFQWWLFAAFAVIMAIRMARDFGLRDDLDEVDTDDEVPTPVG
ncbi:MAG: SURF1 family cytochrome oxidase biogenesis protein [Propionibacteriaceae bacterium]